jgi:hypothetical protein
MTSPPIRRQVAPYKVYDRAALANGLNKAERQELYVTLHQLLRLVNPMDVFDALEVAMRDEIAEALEHPENALGPNRSSLVGPGDVLR